MRTTLAACSFSLAGVLALVGLLAPTAVSAESDDTGAVSISVHYCPGLAAPGIVTDVGEGCNPGSASFDFYLYDDGTADYVTITVGENGVASADLPAGDYEIHESTTDTPVGRFTVAPDAPLNISWGIPRVEAPSGNDALLQVYTFVCESVSGQPMELGEISNDCTQVSRDLTFYPHGGGADERWILRTAESGLSLIELPPGDYNVVDGATRSTVAVRVPDGTSAVAIGYPVVGVSEPSPETPRPTDQADDTPVIGLPETGSGFGAGNAPDFVVSVLGMALLTLTGVRLRQQGRF